jgi:hypothetical protein
MCILSMDFATVGRRPRVYSRGFIHGWIVLHQDWDHQHSEWTCVVRWKSSWDSISPSATTVLYKLVGWNFR